LKCVMRYAKYFKEIEMRLHSQIYIPSRQRERERERERERKRKIYDDVRRFAYMLSDRPYFNLCEALATAAATVAA
jgi:hypothetical protein